MSADGSAVSPLAVPLAATYELDPFFDEMFVAPGEPRPHYRALFELLNAREELV